MIKQFILGKEEYPDWLIDLIKDRKVISCIVDGIDKGILVLYNDYMHLVENGDTILYDGNKIWYETNESVIQNTNEKHIQIITYKSSI